MVIKKRTETEQKRKNGAKRLSLGACGGILIGVEKKKYICTYILSYNQKKAHLPYVLRSVTTLSNNNISALCLLVCCTFPLLKTLWHHLLHGNKTACPPFYNKVTFVTCYSAGNNMLKFTKDDGHAV